MKVKAGCRRKPRAAIAHAVIAKQNAKEFCGKKRSFAEGFRVNFSPSPSSKEVQVPECGRAPRGARGVAVVRQSWVCPRVVGWRHANPIRQSLPIVFPAVTRDTRDTPR
jgi:hypothetical protein